MSKTSSPPFTFRLIGVDLRFEHKNCPGAASDSHNLSAYYFYENDDGEKVHWPVAEKGHPDHEYYEARAVLAEEADSLQTMLQRDDKRACENFALCCVEKDEVSDLSESMGESSEDTLEYMLRGLSVEFECGVHGALQVHTDIQYDDATEAETSGHTSVGPVADRKEELARAFGAQEFLQRKFFRRNGNEFVFAIRGPREDSERVVVRIPAGSWDPSDNVVGQSASDSRLLKDETQGRKEGEEEGASNMHFEN